jgi:hypothetical protein
MCADDARAWCRKPTLLTVGPLYRTLAACHESHAICTACARTRMGWRCLRSGLRVKPWRRSKAKQSRTCEEAHLKGAPGFRQQHLLRRSSQRHATGLVFVCVGRRRFFVLRAVPHRHRTGQSLAGPRCVPRLQDEKSTAYPGNSAALPMVPRSAEDFLGHGRRSWSALHVVRGWSGASPWQPRRVTPIRCLHRSQI